MRVKRQQWIVHLFWVAMVFFPLFSHANTSVDDPSRSIVEITITAAYSQESSPWRTEWDTKIGTGFIIDGKRIITTAGLVENAVYMGIRPNGVAKSFEADIETISHETNLAILKLKGESFFTDRPPLELGGLPTPEQKVSLYGYPVGGSGMSITQGIVSRIEYHTYEHSGLTFQAIQVDAAINSGNGGGPALVDGKVVGIVSDFFDGLENIGYLIPTPRIKQLLEDLKDGALDGVPELWLDYQFITNPTHKKYHKLTDKQSGILINKLCAHTDAALVLDKGDVITAIDGKLITEEDFIQTNGKQYSNFQSHIDLRQVDDIVTLDILSNGYNLKRNVKLNKSSRSTKLKESSPRYFIFGGFVFLATQAAPFCESVAEDETGALSDAKDDVKIVHVLPSYTSNIGFHEAAPMNISTVNGSTFDSFEDFHRLVKLGSSKTIVLENGNGYQVIINRQLAESEHDTLLEKYQIAKPQSAEVDEWE